MKIEVGKTYRTREGYAATVIEDDGSERIPARVLHHHPSGRSLPFWHHRDGRANIGNEQLDLVEEIAEPAIAPELSGRVDLNRYGVSPADGAPFHSRPEYCRTPVADEAAVAAEFANARADALDALGKALEERAEKLAEPAPMADAITSLRRSVKYCAAAIVLLALAVITLASRATAGVAP